MRPALRHTRTLLHRDASAAALLCPARVAPAAVVHGQPARPALLAKPFSTAGRAYQAAGALSPPTRRLLPRACPGCGAPTQSLQKNEAGYYSIDRKAVQGYVGCGLDEKPNPTTEDSIYQKALDNASPELQEKLRPAQVVDTAPAQDLQPPVCDRCHQLIHHHVGTPIHHPTVEAIQQTIAESPHRRNHIYHVVDAADFPLSIIHNLQSSLRIPKLRTQNRRAKHKGWVANDRIAEVSFIITRSDLLAPKKEQVDILMPYVREVLRDALGRQNQNARLGNIRLVSAKRGWWTKQVKEDIWERGGAGWMIGKVNVGKSNLFEAVFPKGRGADYQDVPKIRNAAEREAMLNAAESLEQLKKVQKQLDEEDAETRRLQSKSQQQLDQPSDHNDDHTKNEDEADWEDPDALLPPPQPFTLYPTLPIASYVPGTTVSPIRIPFGRSRGELIDMPGLARTKPGLEAFVQPCFHDSLVMKTRIKSERYVIRPGQSVVIGGGLVRITPLTPDLVFIVHNFVPLTPHITHTTKAIAYQCQVSDRHLESVLAHDAGAYMRSAGTFRLKWDATKQLAGPLTSPSAGKMKPENLPFRIWCTDILLEGVGWIEVSAQMRRPPGWRPPGKFKIHPNHQRFERQLERRVMKIYNRRKFEALARAKRTYRDPEQVLAEEFEEEDNSYEGGVLDGAAGDKDDDQECPAIEVFTPLGKFVGQRRPMCASAVNGPRYVPGRDRKVRPRQSMVSVKNQRAPQEK